ncbi:hypothetical protein [Methylobacterium sp. SD21]|uniref:hypothetical protein n=1 Tax=Methylobacterium litchii TaxID=3138810 RepID=UPI00313D0DE6
MFDWIGRGRRIEAKLDALLWQASALTQESIMANQNLDDLIAQVRANESVEAAAAAAITGLVGRLEQANAIGDGAQFASIIAEMKASASALAAAIPANTAAASTGDDPAPAATEQQGNGTDNAAN